MYYKEEIHPQTSKLVIINDDNSTKGGVDTFAPSLETLNVSHFDTSNGMLDQAGINFVVLYIDAKHSNSPANTIIPEQLSK